eukprot:Pgem_evm1s14465
MIAFRRTSPTAGCINFHTDDRCSKVKETVQYALVNDDTYEGGRICFYSTALGGIIIPKRPA